MVEAARRHRLDDRRVRARSDGGAVVNWGEAAAEQHEQDQPSTCLRPDGASPELPPLKDRQDFIERMEHLYNVRQISGWMGADLAISVDPDNGKGRDQAYYAERVRGAEAQIDQLVLMRAKQILDEAEARRQSVLAKLIRTPVKDFPV